MISDLKAKIILASTLGTFLEFLDYTLYGYFSSTIGRLFFPPENSDLNLLATWGIFSIGFLVRPFGAAVFGYIADRKGRSKILSLTMLFMSCSTIAIGLLPTFNMVGWYAPLLLIFCRIIQGLSISAEYNSSGIVILENNWSRPCFLSALTPFSCGMGMLAAALLAYSFNTSTLSEAQWRLPFILSGAMVGLTSWYLRRTMQETRAFMQLQQSGAVVSNPLKIIAKSNPLPLLTNIICSAYMGSASYLLFVYMSSYLERQFHFPLTIALIISSMFVLIESSICLLFGWVADKVGVAKVLFFASMAMVGAALLFISVGSTSLAGLIMLLLLLVITLGAFDGPLTGYLPQLFKTSMRYSATGIGYNIGGAAIGGSAPLILSSLIYYVPYPKLVLGCYLAIWAALASSMIYFNSIRSRRGMLYSPWAQAE